ncbi:auxin-responsive protein SAUR71 [Amborella trichopoda]|uniref:auxin-responsive protein SAUR71 n=1 Tax=Amborella trichopoda TaxID=13333 RepID=UPI0009C01804|nr:auxin-responsive protein SAUR71 [Amborella trichopoda]|eukprot:XP_006853029.2 auxin-responsive protein SAUR71 [Amborella trichopoda]
MKELIRRLSRLNSPQSLCRSDSGDRSPLMEGSKVCCPEIQLLKDHRKNAKNRQKICWKKEPKSSRKVMEMCVPVLVGEEMESFAVSANVFNHPVFSELLKRSAQVYGYDHVGVLRIPCNVGVFRQIMEVLEESGGSDDVIFRLGKETASSFSIMYGTQNDVYN